MILSFFSQSLSFSIAASFSIPFSITIFLNLSQSQLLVVVSDNQSFQSYVVMWTRNVVVFVHIGSHILIVVLQLLLLISGCHLPLPLLAIMPIPPSCFSHFDAGLYCDVFYDCSNACGSPCVILRDKTKH